MGYHCARRSSLLGPTLILTFSLLQLCAGQTSSQCGRKDSVQMTVMSFKPQNSESTDEPLPHYECYLGAEDTDAVVSSSRAFNTRNGMDKNPQPSSPARLMDTNLPPNTAAYTVTLDTDNDNAFGVFTCDAFKEGRQNTTIFTIFLRSEGYILPSDQLFTKTVDVEDTDVIIDMNVVDSDGIPLFRGAIDIRWRINGSPSIDNPGGGGNYVNDDYELLKNHPISVTDEGVYEPHGNGHRNARQAMQRLIVRSCTAGKWGPPGCNGICDNCYNGGVCDDETGRCICPPGFMGTNCLTACGANKFGYSCEFQCDYGGSSDCIGRLFCLLDPYGCTCNTGYKDLNCMTECEPTKYGASCLQECHCDNNGGCDRFTGVCDSRTCQSGWSGTNCQIRDKCPQGYFGRNCTDKCLCLDGEPCDKDTGACRNGQCAPGSMRGTNGVRCQECPDGFYGDCSEECHCASDACDKTTGECVGCCKPQWVETDSDTCQIGLERSIFSEVNSGQSASVRCEARQATGYSIYLSRERNSLIESGIKRGTRVTETNNQGSLISRIDFTINNASSTDVFYCLLVDNLMQRVAWLNTTFFAYELPVLNDPPTSPSRTNYSVTIRWRAWDAAMDVGDPPVVSHITYYKEMGTDMWIKGRNVSLNESQEFTASGLNMDVNYTFSVAAVREGDGGEGPRSLPLTVKTLCAAPAVPTNVQASLTDDNKIEVSWQIPPGIVCSTGILSFTIYAQIEGSNEEPVMVITVSGDSTSHIISGGLDAGKNYMFQVSVTTDQESAYSLRSGEVMYPGPIDPEPPGSDFPIMFIVIAIVIVLVLAIVIVLVLVVVKRRKKSSPLRNEEMNTYENPAAIIEPQSEGGDATTSSYDAVRKEQSDKTSGMVGTDKSDHLYEVTNGPNPKATRPADPSPRSAPKLAAPSNNTAPKQAVSRPDTVPKPQVSTLPRQQPEGEDDFEEVLPSTGPKPAAADAEEEIYANLPSAILVSSLPEYYKQNEGNLGHEFKLLKKDQQAPWTVSVKPENKKKNRFKKMYTYDHSRVVLEKLPNNEHSDYYNASYIPDLTGRKSFIASQAPNTASVNDFWRMIWTEQVSTVVMLTNLIENGKDRCFKYWPDEQGGSKVFGGIVVSWAATSEFADFVVRKLQVSQNDVIREVIQLHYTTWPDMDVPSQITPLMEFIHQTKRIQKDKQSPILCHCSAGVGRTGTFISLYCLLEVVKKEKKIHIFDFVEKARKNRVNFVQTEKQYVFLYKCLVDYYLTRHTEIPAELLAKFNIKSKRSTLSDEFQLLSQFNQPNVSSFSNHEGNSDKIRVKDSIPNDSGLIFLMSEGANSLSNYINATLFRSIAKADAFITTQSPLPNTIEDFWRLIYDWKCPVIVMLNGTNAKDKTCPQYWPDKGDACYGNLSVSFVNRNKHPLYIHRQFDVAHISQKETRKVHQLQILSWPDNSDFSAVIEIQRNVRQLLGDMAKARPVAVHCRDGVSRSAIYVAVECALEQKRASQTVDVFSVVREMRERNSHVIKTEEEYILIYQILQFILDGDGNYQNV